MAQRSRREVGPIVALGVLALLWGYNWVAIKVATAYCGPFALAAIRTAIAVAALFAAVAVLRRSLAPTPFVPTVVLGVLQTTLFMTLQITAVALGGAGKTAVLAFTMPFWAILLAWPLLGERVRGYGWLAVVLSALGLGFVLVPLNLHAGLLPKLLAVLGAIAWALSAIWLKHVRARYDVDLLSLTTWQMLWGVLPMIALTLFVHERPIAWTPTFIVTLAFIALPATALAWLLWMYALSRLSAGTAGLASLATPVVGVLGAWLQLGERPSVTEWVGIALIIAALAVTATVGALGSRSADEPANRRAPDTRLGRGAGRSENASAP
jgi:drug/metabolite transporter (DMT)-like permease